MQFHNFLSARVGSCWYIICCHVKLHYSLLLIRPQQSLTPRLSTGTTAAPHTVPTVTPQVVTNIQTDADSQSGLPNPTPPIG